MHCIDRHVAKQNLLKSIFKMYLVGDFNLNSYRMKKLVSLQSYDPSKTFSHNRLFFHVSSDDCVVDTKASLNRHLAMT